MANTSKRISHLLNKPRVYKTAVAVRLPKAMRKTAFKESQKPFHPPKHWSEDLPQEDR